MADDFSWAWGGNRDSSRSSTQQASSVGRRPRERDDSNLNEDGTPRNPEDAYGADRPDADRSTSSSRTFYSIANVNAWNRYQDNLRALQQHQETFGTRTIDSQGNILYRYDSQQRLNTARNLRASVFDYQNDQQACNNGDQNACERVGRFGGASSAQYTGQNEGGVYRPERSVAPTTAPPPPEPGDIMGGGETTRPDDADTPANRRARCENSGGRYTDDGGGACYRDVEPTPAPATEPVNPPPEDTRPPERPSVLDPRHRRPLDPPHPAEQTGRQNPDPDHSHRVVNPSASGGGSHSGKDGSKTRAGTDGVVHFDSGTNVKPPQPSGAEIRFLLRNIRAMKDPYKQNDRKCMENKRLVE